MGEVWNSLTKMSKFIRVFNGCEVWIENSVTTVTVRHHKTCRVMPKSYPEWRNFHLAPDDHNGFFILMSCNMGVRNIFILEKFNFDLQFYRQINTTPRLHVLMLTLAEP